MAGKKIHLVVAVVGIALAGGGAWWYQNKSGAGGLKSAGEAGSPGGSSGQGGAASTAGKGGAPGGGGPRGPGGPAAVEVAKVAIQRLEDDSQAVGSLRARQGVVLKPEVSGRIQSLSFGDGQRVRKGRPRPLRRSPAPICSAAASWRRRTSSARAPWTRTLLRWRWRRLRSRWPRLSWGA